MKTRMRNLSFMAAYLSLLCCNLFSKKASKRLRQAGKGKEGQNCAIYIKTLLSNRIQAYIDERKTQNNKIEAKYTEERTHLPVYHLTFLLLIHHRITDGSYLHHILGVDEGLAWRGSDNGSERGGGSRRTGLGVLLREAFSQ